MADPSAGREWFKFNPMISRASHPATIVSWNHFAVKPFPRTNCARNSTVPQLLCGGVQRNNFVDSVISLLPLP